MREAIRFFDLLKRFIYKYMVLTMVIVLGITMGLYGFLHFGVSLNMMQKIEEEVIDNIEEVVHHEASSLSFQLIVVEKHATLIRETYEEIFTNYLQYDINLADASFKIHDNGAYYKDVDNGGSALYYSSTTPLSDDAVEKAIKTEWADPIMKHIVDSDELVSQIYFNTFDHMIRLYPYIDEIPELLGSKQNVQSYNFYYLADEVHNPTQSLVWTAPYLDPTRQGWIISCLAPVYKDTFLEGVIGLDITLDKFIAFSVEFNRLSETIVLLIDEQRQIVTMNQKAYELLVDKQEAYSLVHPIDDNIYSLDHDMLQSLINSGINNKHGYVAYADDTYMVYTEDIDENGWQLITLTSTEHIKNNVREISRSIQRNFVWMMMILLPLIVILLILYRRRIHRMSKQISEPLAAMAFQAKQFGLEGQFSRIQETGIKEIDDLNHELFTMSKEIRYRTLKLLHAQLKNQKAEKTIKTYYKEATTDELTQLYNRRKIDDLIDSEVKRCRRYQCQFSILLLDVDSFKTINDVYGHQTGDEVLKGMARVLSRMVRETDVVARWGGDEFIVMVYEASRSEAYLLAEKIRVAIKEAVIYADISVTTSIGVTDFDYRSDDARDILKKADLALYEAKNRGKNNVVQYIINGDKHEYI